jgi:methionyl-tRNA formyltransferase
MTFVYFGSFHLSADILEGLIAGGFMPTHVVCSPDKPAGRKKVLTAPAIKTLITNNKWPIEILQPESLPVSSLDLPAGRQELENWKLKIGKVDLAIVMGYPKIIPLEIINLPRLGTVGVHPSLLPKYRGASPIQTAILNGDTETGVTLYQIDEKMDSGPILANGRWKVADGTTNTELEKELAKVAVNLLINTLPKFIAGKITPVEQDHAQATFTRKFTSADGEVDMVNDDPKIIYNKIRAFNPEPSVWTMNYPGHEGKRVKLISANWNTRNPNAPVGGKGSNLVITSIQVEGKKPIEI